MNKEITSNNHFASNNLSYLRKERSPVSEMLFVRFCTFKTLDGAKFVSELALNPNNLVHLTLATQLISEELSQLQESVFQSILPLAKTLLFSHTLAMMRHKFSGPKCDRIFSRISSGKSFSDLGSLAITDGSEITLVLLQYESNAVDSTPTTYRSNTFRHE
jgi:hypothetical protein